MELVEFFKSATTKYWGSSKLYIALFFIALLAILIFEKNRSNRSGLLWYPVLVVLFVFYNPISYYVCSYFFTGGFLQYYMRLMVVVAVPIVVAYGFTLLVGRLRGLSQLLVLVIALMLLSRYGANVYYDSVFTKADNNAKIIQDVYDITDYFFGDNGVAVDEESLRIFVTKDMSVYMRQLDSRYVLTYSRDAGPNSVGKLLALSDPTREQVYTVVKTAINYSVPYILATYSEAALQLYLEQGCELLTRTTNCMLLSPPESATIFYTVTMNEDESGSQRNFYPITGTDGSLIVIDGGNAANYSQVMSVISAHDNKVDLWIISHPHPDHISVLNQALAEGTVTIGQIWDNGIDTTEEYEFMASVAKSVDGLECLTEYLSLTAGMSNIVHIQKGDVRTFGQLTFTFYSAFSSSFICTDDEGAQYYYYGDAFNNSSLVYEVTSSSSDVSFLFNHDARGEAISEALIAEYGDQLAATYCNMGHHGNNTLTMAYYELVDAEIYFFDAPAWLVYGSSYTTMDSIRYLISLHKSFVWWNDAPYSVNLY